VLDPHPPRSATRTAAGFQRFARLDATPARAVRAMVDERGASGLPRPALSSRAGLAPQDATRVADELIAAGDVLAIGDALVARAVVGALAEALVGLVSEHHRTSPLSEGLPREEARERLFARAAPGLFDHVLTELDRDRRLRGRDRLAIPGQGVALSPEEARARETLARVYREAGLTPPDLAGAAAAGGIAPDVADRVAKLLVREKTLLKLDALLFHAERLRVLKDEVAAMKAPAGPGRVDVASFKERYGISRKYAIPLLEYLDRERVTRRAGEARVIL
jgi:selenocysteine-specific elongation factor